jgi:putative zinc finger/helix-turn-helix YgiT family protein
MRCKERELASRRGLSSRREWAMKRICRNDPLKCERCGGVAVFDYAAVERFAEGGLKDVYLVDVDVLRCPMCLHRKPFIRRQSQLHRAIAREIVLQRSRLSGPQIKFIRKALAWTALEFSKKLGVSAGAVSKWENGRDRISRMADRLLRVVALVFLGDAATLPEVLDDLGGSEEGYGIWMRFGPSGWIASDKRAAMLDLSARAETDPPSQGEPVDLQNLKNVVPMS